MSTGPQGGQGLQGAYGPRGITGAFGWGYGTITGPTGSVGYIRISVPSTSTVSVTTANASSLFRLQNASTYVDSNSITKNSVYYSLPSGLDSNNEGQFWTFSNDISPSGSLDLLPTGSSTATLTIKPYASATFVYKGGSNSTEISNYSLF
jgi:hypothetical protein